MLSTRSEGRARFSEVFVDERLKDNDPIDIDRGIRGIKNIQMSMKLKKKRRQSHL